MKTVTCLDEDNYVKIIKCAYCTMSLISTFYPQSRPALLNKVAGNNWNSGNWQKYGPGGFRAFNETLGPEVCQRPGLFRHPTGEPDSGGIESRTKPALIFFQTAPSSTSATGTSGLRSSRFTSSPAPSPWPSASTTSPSPPATGPSSGLSVRLEQGFENESISESQRDSSTVTVMKTPSRCRSKTREPEKTVMDAVSSSRTRGIFGHLRTRAVIF